MTTDSLDAVMQARPWLQARSPREYDNDASAYGHGTHSKCFLEKLLPVAMMQNNAIWWCIQLQCFFVCAVHYAERQDSTQNVFSHQFY